MISFSKTRDFQLFQDFVTEYGGCDNLRDRNETFQVVLPGEFLAGIFDSNEYICRNSKYIFYNEEKCNEIRLTVLERYACLAHELGHFYDNTEQNAANQQDREKNADNFAVSLCLGCNLSSALQKMRSSLNDDEKERIDERISNLAH